MPRSRNSSRRTFLHHLALGTAGAALAQFGRSGLHAQPTPPPGGPSRDQRKLGVALVGLGGYATGQLAPALQQTRWCQLTGVVTGDRAKGDRWSREYAFPAENVYSYDTMAGIADNRTIDILYIVTPPGRHARDSIAAARAGKHVVCEKPMANTVAECDAIIAACREHNVKHSIGYRLEFDPHHQELDRLARQGRTPPFRRIDGAHAFHAGNPGWRADAAMAGGGPLMDLGIYVVQAACRAAAGVMPLAVTAQELPKERPAVFATVEESIRWTMEFPGDVRADGFTSYHSRGNHFEADGPEASISFKPAFSYRGIRGKTHRGPLELPSVNQQAAQMDDFARRILDNEPSPVSGELGRMHMVIIEAIYEAARTGGRVAIPAEARRRWAAVPDRDVQPHPPLPAAK